MIFDIQQLASDLDLPMGKARKIAALTQAVGVRSPEQPSPSKVMAALDAMAAGRPLGDEEASIVRRVVMDAEPFDLRGYLESDKASYHFLAAASRALPGLRQAASVVAARLGLDTAAVLAIRNAS